MGSLVVFILAIHSEWFFTYHNPAGSHHFYLFQFKIKWDVILVETVNLRVVRIMAPVVQVDATG